MRRDGGSGSRNGTRMGIAGLGGNSHGSIVSFWHGN
jgi:hypothetical protein